MWDLNEKMIIYKKTKNNDTKKIKNVKKERKKKNGFKIK